MVIPENYYIYISVFIGLIYLVMIYFGYKRGFLYELVSLVYTALSLALAWFASPVFASLFPLFDISKLNGQYELLDKAFNLNKLLNTVAYFLIIFLLMKLLYVFISLVVKFLNKIPVLGSVNKALGACFGVLNATVIALALSMLLSLPLFSNGKEVREKTILKYITGVSDDALSYIVSLLSDSNIKQDVDGIDIDSYREDFKEWLIHVSNANE
ncbi:MAG: CvpA family protein [Erysipelotrichaceae bacterium]|nr:CvpA family protein [Erysipelotrichaceae bacterium]